MSADHHDEPREIDPLVALGLAQAVPQLDPAPELRARPDIAVSDVMPRVGLVFMALAVLVLFGGRQ